MKRKLRGNSPHMLILVQTRVSVMTRVVSRQSMTYVGVAVLGPLEKLAENCPNQKFWDPMQSGKFIGFC